MTSTPRGVSGRLIAVAVMTLGVSLGALGVWWMWKAPPAPGAYIDVLALGREAAVAVRHEREGHRSFVELIEAAGPRWTKLVPQYAEPAHGVGLAASPDAVLVRVIRDGRPEIFGLGAGEASKLAGLHLAMEKPPSPGGYTLPRATTVSDGRQAFQLFGVDGEWTTVVALALATGAPGWQIDAGPRRIARVTAEPDALVIEDVDGSRRGFDRETGAMRELSPAPAAVPGVIDVGGVPHRVEGVAAEDLVVLASPGAHVLYAPAERALAVVDDAGGVRAEVAWPVEAHPPQAHHIAGGALWMVTPERVVALDLMALTPVATPGAKGPVLNKSSRFRLVALPATAP